MEACRVCLYKQLKVIMISFLKFKLNVLQANVFHEVIARLPERDGVVSSPPLRTVV